MFCPEKVDIKSTKNGYSKRGAKRVFIDGIPKSEWLKGMKI
jgi:hypothetical protein